jgi:hypothetical protein
MDERKSGHCPGCDCLWGACHRDDCKWMEEARKVPVPESAVYKPERVREGILMGKITEEGAWKSSTLAELIANTKPHTEDRYFCAGMGNPWTLARAILGSGVTEEEVGKVGVMIRNYATAWGEQMAEMVHRQRSETMTDDQLAREGLQRKAKMREFL